MPKKGVGLMSCNNAAHMLIEHEYGDVKIDFNKWINLTIPTSYEHLNLSTLRVLGYLFDECGHNRGHTKSIIADKLNLWDNQINETIDGLEQQGFINVERISYGMGLLGRMRTIRVYHLTELGHFYLNQIDTQFPGLWLTQK